MALTVHLTLTANGEAVEGESTITTLERENTIECFSFSSGVQAGVEGFSGAPSGARSYDPITIVKRIDKSTPLLWKALCLNEAIEGTFKFYRPDPAGQGVTEHFYTVEITEGRVAGIELNSPDALSPALSGVPPTETVRLVFNNVTQTYEATGAAHQDLFREQQ